MKNCTVLEDVDPTVFIEVNILNILRSRKTTERIFQTSIICFQIIKMPAVVISDVPMKFDETIQNAELWFLFFVLLLLLFCLSWMEKTKVK